ncbi:C40 family peptidase [Cellulosilyticum ruminicola]|uniref:C40 family peptidase n=1 Tax=Cellulosilyticum ruminicola TaxID=425254 RepID=UPI0006CFF294|nr:SH3 domain-containing C40 family peptidase [Cellulosilyticum ruminicola]
MKFLVKRVLVVGLALFTSTSLYASTTKPSIFPNYTGLSANICKEHINVKSYPDEYAECIGQTTSRKVYIIGQNNDWYKVNLNGEVGWIDKSDIQIEDTNYVPYSKVLGEEIVDYGKQFIGTPYVWGGNDLKKGVDCSGLTKGIYKTFDIHITRLAATQVEDGKIIDKKELRPGDLVFFDTTGYNTGKISHVGIYAGNNMFLHADGTNGVMLSRLDSPYYTRNYVTSSRIINS